MNTAASGIAADTPVFVLAPYVGTDRNLTYTARMEFRVNPPTRRTIHSPPEEDDHETHPYRGNRYRLPTPRQC